MSLGDLFVQLGVVGDAKEIDDVIKKAEKQLKLTQEQIKANEKVKQTGKQFEENFKFGKISEQFKKFQMGFKIGFSGKNGVNGLINGLGQGLKMAGGSGLAAAAGIGLAVGAIVGIGIATVKAYQAIDRLTESLVNNNQQWVNLANQTDLAFDRLQSYAGVAGLWDKSLGAGGAASSIAQLNERLFELQLTGQGARGFQIAGINPTSQDALGVLEQVRNRISGLKNTQATYLLKQIGLDPKLLPMLRMTADEFERLRQIEERYILTEEQRRDIQRMNIQLELARQKWQYLKDRAILAIMPHFVRLTKNLAFLVDIFIKGAKWIGDWNKKLNDMNTGLGKMYTIIKKIFQVFNPFSFLNPFKWLYELFDDLEHYVNGGGSVIGVIMYQLERLKQGLSMDDMLPEWLKMLVSVTDKLYSLFGNGKSNRINLSDNPLSKGLDNAAILNPLNPLSVSKVLTKQIADNRVVYQTIHIRTSEAAQVVKNNLRYAYGGMGSVN